MTDTLPIDASRTADKIKIRACDVERAVVAHFNFRRNVIVPNVSWGMLPWEADLLILTKAKYLIEIEIKVSLSDLKRDVDKDKWHERHKTNKLIRQRYFAMPFPLATSDAAKEICAGLGAGIIGFDFNVIRRGQPETHRLAEAPANPHALPLTDKLQFKLLRLGVLRYWSRHWRQ